jgi:phosphoglucosamine mutase
MHLTLDLANGSNYNIAPKVFKKAGYDISVINDKPNGKNINDKCGSTYLNDLPSIIKGNGSKFAISMDGDGDRLLVVNEDGKVLDGDDILYTIIKGKNILNENIKGVVGTTMTNYAFEKFLKEEGIDFIRANVGDKNVMEKMLQNNYLLGGETSGHILMLDKSSSGDSIIAALQFLYYSDILNKKNINYKLKKYPQKITNLLIDKDLPENTVNIAIKEASDKFSKNNLRLIIRKSGTENCIRIMVEAEDLDLVNSSSEEIKDFINNNLIALSS